MSSDDPWQEILSGCKVTASNPDGTVFFAGPSSSNKPEFIQQLANSANAAFMGSGDINAYGLDLSYFDATHSEDKDDYLASKLCFWSLSDPKFESLIEQAHIDSTENCALLVAVDLSKPWEIMTTLEKWVNLLDSKLKARFGQKGEDNSSRIPIMFVCMNPELMHFDDRLETDTKSMFVQHHIRQFAMTVNASVAFVPQNPTQIHHIYEQILSMVFPKKYSFKPEAQFSDRDNIFLPVGWDTEGKLEGLLSGKFTGRETYSSVVPSPIEEKNEETEVKAKPHSEWLEDLAKVQVQKQRKPIRSFARDSTSALPSTTGATVSSTRPSTVRSLLTKKTSGTKKTSDAKNFFNKLKGSGTGRFKPM
eukprot:TRINITY_DN781950_c0_g1_i1.p1 TRINITY_DN781950_c0_g1~~TRINITY_DN781950_c0_g1_i1.p1  ORF type:complete len:363 (+),score=89.98 TRINITY_DN781950_c0_g1_i1:45-1133(+)